MDWTSRYVRAPAGPEGVGVRARQNAGKARQLGEL